MAKPDPTAPAHPREAPPAQAGETLLVGAESAIGGADATDITFGFLRPTHQESSPLPKIPGYETLRVLGRGGMGIVYLARQTQLDRLVALKMILAGHEARPEDLERFRAEAQAIARLQHPNIVQLHDLGQFEGRPYFSLEYVSGGCLAEATAGKPQPARQAAELIETLARAMQYAHDRGIVHRDLKPANVLLAPPASSRPAEAVDDRRTAPVAPPNGAWRTADGAPTPKIADFGLARLMHRDSHLTRTGDVVGTPSYMAPEQAQGLAGELGPRVDVYALGAILYELLTGRPPFQGVSPVDTLMMVATCEPPSPSLFQPKLPRDLQTICLRCLQKEPEKRYASAQELADDLRRFLEDRPIVARPIGRAEKLIRWSRRNPALAGALAALAFVLAAGFATATGLWRYAEGKRGQAEANAQAAQTALLQARKSEAEAKAANASAVRNLDRALRAIDQTLVKVAQLEQSRLPGFEPERVALLEDALKILNETLQENAAATEARRQTAEVSRRVAEIYRQLSRLPECEAAYLRGLELCRALAREQPDSFRAQASLLAMLNGIAAFRAKQLQTAEAAKLQAEALRAAEAALALCADGSFTCGDVGYARQMLGSYLLESGGPKAALPHLEKGIAELRQALEAKGAPAANLQAHLSHALTYLARAQAGVGRTAEGEASFRAAFALAEEAVKAQPDDIDAKVRLSAVAGDFGTYLSFIPKNAEALERFEEAKRLNLEAAASRPNRPDLPSFAARALMNATVIHLRQGELEKGTAACREANAINERLAKAYPQVSEYQMNLARGLYLYCAVLSQQGEWPETRTQAVRALGLAEAQAKRFASKPEIALLPAQLQMQLVEVAMNTGDIAEAESRLGSCIALLTELRRRFPDDKVIQMQEEMAQRAKAAIAAARKDSASQP